MNANDKSNESKMASVPSGNKDLPDANNPKETSEAELTADVQDMPPEVRRQFQAILAMFQAQRPMSNPLLSKFNETHIDKYLDYLQRDDDNAHELKKSNRWFYLAYFTLSLIALGAAIVYLLPNNKDFLETILQILIALAGGIGAGYGLQLHKKG